ncbi:SAM-dependent methyltransferase [Candidatus Albibeggiatoa sp. nov. NOAA]|uniref:class I SAM-dependent methyltransferase n=1 Tax=Candidatus Albibeggiatoa sp. nov. NOAA TaxID=3162724 RepID=UPI0032F1D2BD|nr:SAM-dependent methyltransferase [Thiotrichaceae bacterium]
MSQLPQPTASEQAYSQQLKQVIIQKIQQAGGAIPFSEFMQLALYEPQLGYYTGNKHKFGAKGDFITAPELSPLFAQTLARQCQQILQNEKHDTILEFGAGSGILAAGLLKSLEQLGCLPQQYLILELSADLKQLQQETIEKHVPHLLDRVQWLYALPEQKINGVVVANEVLDAMPVTKFQATEQGINEYYVAVDENEQFIWQMQTYENQEIASLIEKYQLPADYESEMNPQVKGWIQAIADTLESGIALLIDYGFLQDTFYHPQRSMGTLMCHYKHYAHPDPLIYVGLQDITAHVDFTAVGEAAIESGLQVAGYSNQGNFLMQAGLLQIMESIEDKESKEYFNFSQQAKILLMPQEMGETFKVMALATADFDDRLLGFV